MGCLLFEHCMKREFFYLINKKYEPIVNFCSKWIVNFIFLYFKWSSDM
jgi:hypothetical protein